MNEEYMRQDDYVQRMFQDQFSRDHSHGKFVRVFPWVIATIGALSLVAYALREYWYPYISPYLQY